nr:WAT1-related protein At3g28050-like isoform X1 [Ipomoea batatas]
MAMGNEILRKEVVPFAAMIVVVCMEMATSTIAKAALNSGISTFIFVLYYNFLGILLLLPGFLIQRHRRNPLPITFSILGRCFILGLLGTCLVLGLGFQGLSYSSPTLGASISNLMPGFTFVLAMIFRMEKFETTTLKDYPEQMTVVFFTCCFGSIQWAIVSVLVERKVDAWKLQPGIGMAAIVVSAVLEPLCCKNITTFCLDTKGPLYVAMFKPLGIVIAATLNLVFLAEALHLGR